MAPAMKGRGLGLVAGGSAERARRPSPAVAGGEPRRGESAGATAKPRDRLQNRVARYIAFVVVVTLLATGTVVVISRQRSLVAAMERSARIYAALVSVPLATAVDLYRTTGHHVLRQRVRSLVELNRDLLRIQVVDVQGRVALSASRDEIEVYPNPEVAPVLEDHELLERVRDLELHAERIVRPGAGRAYRVVAPAVEDWGRHTFTVVLDLGYRNVNRELLGMAAVMGGLLMVGLLVADRVAVALAGTITRGVDRLTAGVHRFQEGELAERVEVASNDEIEELAEAFNAMAGDLARTIDELRAANRELESLDQAKADLVANVSHELKTPLTALRGYLELLAHGDLGGVTPEAARALEVCLKNVRRLSLRIEELVELSRLEKDVVPQLVTDSVHLAKLLHGVVETMLPRLEESGLVCSLNLSGELPPIVASAEHLERAFLNLLDNAAKFTPAGGTIRVSAEHSVHEGRGGVLVRVSDTGVGIPAGEQVRIFDRFYQVDPSARRRYGGMGLGLALVRSIVEAHRGAVWVSSEPGRGSTFFVWLPDRMRDSSSSGRHPVLVRTPSGRLSRPADSPDRLVGDS